MDMVIILVQAIERKVPWEVAKDFLHHRPNLFDTIVNNLPWRFREFPPQNSYGFRKYVLRRIKHKHAP